MSGRSGLRQRLDRMRPLFARGGRFEKFSVVFEMIDTLLYTPARPTRTAPHVRDHLDLKRIMIFVVLACLPAMLVGIYNVGLQANLALAGLGPATDGGSWRNVVLDGLSIGYDPGDLPACFVHGLLFFLPLYLVTLVVGGFWEVLFATLRRHEVNEGFLVTSWLFVATLPPTLPLWQAALGISFGVVIGKEVFGGTGKNFLNPALVGRAFLFFSYPAWMSGDAVWVAVDGYTGATPLAMAANGGMAAIHEAGITWQAAFIGTIPGSLGETSALACLIGALFLVYTGIASGRIMLAVVLGMVCATLLANGLGSGGDSAFSQMPWHWHMVLGGAAFGLVFMATDPVSAALTPAGKWLYGLFIGAVCILIRIANPAYAEGMMLAILLGNVIAPLLDYLVIRLHVHRRRRRRARVE
ncbi:MAG: NADH:ubiquinone reductase (Na(+)-transporting) subunit B [Gammaproteobacteria bacterium]|nr:NADH:ubiquinone reductase (Na(+)-transporting) subunit B [Gammaproteobacteria bacterium]MDH5650510.1 NADH:ubiquinone reductase (Na(+)-transporting) subunit B [Gammaproteobacteria bacterium]